jgi:hypothetical protein
MGTWPGLSWFCSQVPMPPKNPPGRYGLMVAPLDGVHPDRVTVSGETFYLRKGERCTLSAGVRVEVWYSERGGRKEIERIVEAAPGSSM